VPAPVAEDCANASGVAKTDYFGTSEAVPAGEKPLPIKKGEKVGMSPDEVKDYEAISDTVHQRTLGCGRSHQKWGALVKSRKVKSPKAK